MAPEVVNRKGHHFSADWWSFGVLMVNFKAIQVITIWVKYQAKMCSSFFMTV